MASKYGPSRLNKFLAGLFCLSLWRKGALCCNINCSCFNDVESPEAERHRAEAARWQYRSEKNAARQERRSERAEKTQAKRDSKRRPREKKKSAADSGRTESSAAASSLSTVPATSEERGESSNSTNASGQGDTNRILKPESLVRQEDTALPAQTIAAKEASGASDSSTRKSKEDRRKAKRANKEQRRAKRTGSKATSPS